MLRSLVRRNTLLQRALTRARTVRVRRSLPEGLVPPTPRRLVVEPTNACNLGCAYCGNKDMVRPTAYLDLGVYQRLLDEMAALDVPNLTLHTIGEPLLHPRIADMVALAAERRRVVRISTNGTLLTEDRARALVEAGPDVLAVSADAADPEVLARTRDGLELELLLDGLRRLHRLREERGPLRETPWGAVRVPSIALTCVVTPLFTRVVERQLFEVFGPLVDDVHFQWPNNHAGYVRDEPFARRGVLPRAWRDALYGALREPCPYPWDSLFLLADGSVSVCRFDFDARVVVGRFPERSLEDLWRSQAMAGLRRAHMDGDFRDWEQCRSCSAMLYANRLADRRASERLKRRNGYRSRRDLWAPLAVDGA